MSDSSPTNLDSGQPSDVTTDQNAESSAAQGQEKSPVDLVFEALGQTDEEKSPASEQGRSDPNATTQAETPEKEPLGDPTEEELKSYKPRTRERFEQLIGQREDLRAQVDAIKPRADAFEAIEQFARTHRASMEDVSQTLNLMALVKTNPEAAYEPVLALVMQLAEATGRILPPDIQEAVSLGRVPEDVARRMVQAERGVQLAGQRAQQNAQETQERAEQDRLVRLRDDAMATANEWEANRKRVDPDWQAKQPRVMELVELSVLRNGFPQTKQAVRVLMDDVLKKVEADFTRFTPKPRQVSSHVGGASPNTTREPKSSQEAALLALGFDV